MAIVIPGHIVSDVHGSIGSVTVKGVRAGLSAQSRCRGSVRRSQASADHLSVFSATSALWRGLSAAARLAWHNAAGDAAGGQQLFQRVVMSRRRSNGVWDLRLPDAVDQGAIGVVTLDACSTPLTCVLTWTGREVVSHTSVLLYYCVYSSAAVAAPRGGWRGPVTVAELNDGVLDLVATFGTGEDFLVSGKSIGMGLATFTIVGAKISGITRVRAVVGL